MSVTTSSPVSGKYQVDRDRTVTDWDLGAEQITGFKLMDMQGRRCAHSLNHSTDESGKKRLCNHGCPLRVSLEAGESRTMHLYARHADGRRLPMRVHTYPVLEGNKIVGAVQEFKEVPLKSVDAEQWGDLFTLTPAGTSIETRNLALQRLEEELKTRQLSFLGYQERKNLKYAQDLSWMLEYPVNNVGDPWETEGYKLNTKAVETRVLDYFAELWHANGPHDDRDRDSYWGYLLSMGSTEGNLYAMWSARDYLSGKPPWNSESRKDQKEIPESRKENRNAKPVLFYSQDTHYSITKATQMIKLRTFGEMGNRKYPGECPDKYRLHNGRWPDAVPSCHGEDGSGEIDVEALGDLVDFFARRGHPIAINLNYGSTFKGAYDDVEEVISTVVPIVKKYGLYEREVNYAPAASDTRHGFWIHVDGALGAAYMPFLKLAQDRGEFPCNPPVPAFDFALQHVFSITLSGHKWIGSPWPSGLFMTKVKYRSAPPSYPAYIGSPDTTLAGSRNGFSPLVFWDRLSRLSYEDQIALAIQGQKLAEYTEGKLIELNRVIRGGLDVERSPLSLTVRFRQPSDDLVRKYSLSTQKMQNGRQVAHVFLMPGITEEEIDEFIDDLSRAY